MISLLNKISLQQLTLTPSSIKVFLSRTAQTSFQEIHSPIKSSSFVGKGMFSENLLILIR